VPDARTVWLYREALAQAGKVEELFQQFDGYLARQGNTGAGVWADAAYRSEEMEAKLKARKLKSHLHRKGKRGKPLTEQAKGSKRTKSSVRARVEHIFGAQANHMGGTLVRTIGVVRARAKIGMKNLAYTMHRLGQLRRLNPCPA
jgi:IS5 family transposase